MNWVAFGETEVGGTLPPPINLSEVCLPFNKKNILSLVWKCVVYATCVGVPMTSEKGARFIKG